MHLKIVEVQDPSNAFPDSEGYHTVHTISEWRGLLEQFRSGDLYLLSDPEGEMHKVTLSPWVGRDEDHVWLQISFHKGLANRPPAAQGPYELP
ncbi:MAG TPA: hypothetical protein VFJ77_02245 [Gaiellaceae bacterium]|nr:hypothetical protein [Gaiellaceae bacterium]